MARGRAGYSLPVFFPTTEEDTTPAVLRAQSPRSLERVLQDVAGTSVDLLAGHFIGPDMRDGVAYDTGGWHMYSQGGTARIVSTKYGPRQKRRKAMRVEMYDPYAWQCRNIGEWSFTGSFAVMLVMSIHAEGVGGTFIGNVKGPHIGNPHTPTGMNFGNDRGWMISANGNGGIGFAIYGDENIVDQDARVYRPNTDSANDGSVNTKDRQVRAWILGWNPNYGGAGKGAGYLYGPTAGMQMHEYFDAGGGVGDVGDTSSTDGRMSFGDVNYGSDNVNYATAELLMMASFTGPAADNIHALRAEIPEALQESFW